MLRTKSAKPPMNEILRRGMDETVIHAVCDMLPVRIVYVSCNPVTLARDILRFCERGYSLRAATAVDMFPRTCHVECVCQLSMRK